MPLALLLAVASCASATTLTYLYLRNANFLIRLCAGVCTGFATLGLLGFMLALVMGMKPAALVLTPVMSLPLLLLRKPGWRSRVLEDVRHDFNTIRGAILQPSWERTGDLLFCIGVAIVLWQLCNRAMFENVQGVFTGLDTNLGDLPFHLSLITSFVHG